MELIFHRLVQKDLQAVLGYYESEGGAALADRFFPSWRNGLIKLRRSRVGFIRSRTACAART